MRNGDTFIGYVVDAVVATMSFLIIMVIICLVIAPPVLALLLDNALWLLLWLAFPFAAALVKMIYDR